MQTYNKSKISGLFFIALFFCPTLFAQTNSSVLTDNKLKSKLDTAIDHAVKTYLQDSNTNGVSIGVFYKTKNYTYNYGKRTIDRVYHLNSPLLCQVAKEDDHWVIQHEMLDVYASGASIDEAEFDFYNEFDTSYKFFEGVNEETLSDRLIIAKQMMKAYIKTITVN